MAYSIIDYHQSKPTHPIRCVHLNGDMFVLRYLLDIPHPLQVTANGFLVHTIFEGKLTQRLLALNIVDYYLRLIAANTAIKTAATVLAFISLGAASQAIVDHIL